MSHIITNDEYYKNISNILRERLGTDYHYYPAEMPDAIRRIPQSIAGVDDVVTGIYLYNHDDEGYPTKLKVVGWGSFIDTTYKNNFAMEKLKTRLQEVEFFNCSFTKIADNAFDGLAKISSIEIPDTVTYIGNRALNECNNLTSFNFPDSVTGTGHGVFRNCRNLINVHISNNIVKLSSELFVYDSLLKTVNIPASVKTIGSGVFLDCRSLQFVELGQGFNANGLDLSASNSYTRETILQWLNALANRTGETTYKLTIGATNLKKLTEEDIAIATAKNWTLA